MLAGVSNNMSTITSKATETITYVANSIDPYVPAAAKDAAGYVASTTQSVANTAYETASSTATRAVETSNATAGYVAQKATDVVEYGKGAVASAQSTITSYTPDPVLQLIDNTMQGAQAVRDDPVGTVKAYVPTFVIQAGEKTYEVVSTTADNAKQTAQETGGFIVTKVNGTVDYITHIPQVENLVTELKKLIPASEKGEKAKSEE